MSALFPDTAPAAERVQIDLLRRAPAWRKLRAMDQLNQSVRVLALGGLRQRLADLTPGPELARRVYSPGPADA